MHKHRIVKSEDINNVILVEHSFHVKFYIRNSGPLCQYNLPFSLYTISYTQNVVKIRSNFFSFTFALRLRAHRFLQLCPFGSLRSSHNCLYFLKSFVISYFLQFPHPATEYELVRWHFNKKT